AKTAIAVGTATAISCVSRRCAPTTGTIDWTIDSASARTRAKWPISTLICSLHQARNRTSPVWMRQSFVFTHFRTQNRFTLLPEMLFPLLAFPDALFLQAVGKVLGDVILIVFRQHVVGAENPAISETPFGDDALPFAEEIRRNALEN